MSVFLSILLAATALAQSVSPSSDGFQTHTAEQRSSAEWSPSEIESVRALGDVSPAFVIGTDERWRVSPTTGLPARTIAQLFMWDAYGYLSGGCTGTFIGPNVLITAAHCLYNPPSLGGWASGIVVIPGDDGGTYPYGYDFASNFAVPNNWYYYGDGNSDWGLVVMGSSALGDAVGWLQLGVLTDRTLNGTSFSPEIAGYPGDKPPETQWEGSKASFYAVETYVLKHLVDTYGGMSGSAVRRASDNIVAGIHVRGTTVGGVPTWNEAVRVTNSVVSTAQSMCSSLGCSFTPYVEPVASPTPTRTPTATPTPTPTGTPMATPSGASYRVYLPLVIRP